MITVSGDGYLSQGLGKGVVPLGLEEVGALVLVGGVEEETVALQDEALLLFTDAALAEDEELFAAGQAPG